MLSRQRIVILSLITLICACSTTGEPILQDRKVEYRKQQVTEADLEVPPDLVNTTIGDSMPVPGDTATYSRYESTHHSGQRLIGSTEVLPEVVDIKVMRDGNQRWLEIKAPPEKVWQKVLAFWHDSGIALIEQNPATGVMRTDWLENRATIKQGFITDLLRKALDSLYTSATRDQYRVRLELGTSQGITALYLTQRGLEEQMVTTLGGDNQNSFWVPRPNDPGLEAEMLRRIMVYFGVAEQAAGTSLTKTQEPPLARSTLERLQDGRTVLAVKADVATTWRLVGIALERVGFLVEDRDSSNNTYYVHYEDPIKHDQGGFFSSLAFWRAKKGEASGKYRIHLVTASAFSQVVVLNDQGLPEQSETAIRILTLIQEQIH